MLMQTKDLTGPALDWAVAKAEGKNGVLHDDGITRCIVIAAPSGVYKGTWAPTINWAQGGPIIERECMVSSCFAPLPDSLHYDPANPTRKQWFYWNDRTGMVAGPTPLIAAMRCLVASKLGDTVDVPEELL